MFDTSFDVKYTQCIKLMATKQMKQLTKTSLMNYTKRDIPANEQLELANTNDRKLEERAQRWMNPDSVKYFLSLFSVFFF